MKPHLILFFVLATLWPPLALAYIGPGTGLSGLGSLLALVAVVVVAILGFVWYPVKRAVRYLRRNKTSGPSAVDSKSTETDK